MKQRFLFLASFCLLLIQTSCQKAGQIHLISAHTWVVTDITGFSTFVQLGDEVNFLDNRLYFKNSNGFETDGSWDFLGRDATPFVSSSVTGLFVNTGFNYHEFNILKLNANELELTESNTSLGGTYTVNLKPKE